MLEAILQELIDLTDMHRVAEEENTEEDFAKILSSEIHPREEILEKQTPGFYVQWVEEYRMYGLLPVDR
jgi:hypothetical protein